MPTYRSTGETTVAIVERDSDGATRVARAVQDPHNPRQWRTQLEHPSGTRQCSNVYGNRGDAALALAHYLTETQNEWAQERARGGKAVPTMRPDRNVPVDPLGQDIVAPVSRYMR